MAIVKVRVCDRCQDPTKPNLTVFRLGTMSTLRKAYLCADCSKPIRDTLKNMTPKGRNTAKVMSMDDLRAEVAAARELGRARRR